MLYRIIRDMGAIVFRLLGLRVEGLDNLPNQGGIILAANHISNWDPLLLGFALPRSIYYMAKAELYENRLLGKIMKAVNTFPIKRGTADRQAIKMALSLLAQGKIVGIFPEGTRKTKGEAIEIKSGTSLLVLMSNCSVVPVACIGSRRILPIGWINPVIIRFGKPIEFNRLENRKLNAANMEIVTNKIEAEITALLQK